MRKIFFCLFLLLSLNLFSQTKLPEVQKYKQVGLVWGLLKYHHPEISKGKYNWDLEFITLFDKVVAVKNQDEMNDLLLGFISKYKTDKLKPKSLNSEKLFLKNVDYDWIDSAVFGAELVKNLIEIKNNRNINNYYVSTSKMSKMLSFENEKGFKDFDYAMKSHRMLLLFNFWNAIQYWDVNKYLMDTKWPDNLDALTQEFLSADTKLKFELVKLKLISKLDDSHSVTLSVDVGNSFFSYKPVFSGKILNDSIVIDKIKNKNLAKKDGIELGDVIVKIENKNISTYLNEKCTNLFSVSNLNYLKRWGSHDEVWFVYNLLLSNNKDSINVDVVTRKGIRENKYIHLYKGSHFDDFETLGRLKKEKWFYVQPNIAYVNLEQITKKELDVVFKQVANTKGLILDLRNYPKNISNNDLAKYLYPERKEFIKILFPIENNPSYGEYDGEAPLKLIMNPFNAGSSNSNYYKGKVVLLVDRTTQSKAEYIGMAIQQAPDCTTLGEQTAGSPLNIVNYMMSDKTNVNFTGLGGFYPSGEGVQRNGLHIDHYVNESAKNYDPELYIKEAIRLIENSSI